MLRARCPKAFGSLGMQMDGVGQRHSRQGKGWFKIQMQQSELRPRSGISGSDLKAVGRAQWAEGCGLAQRSPQEI